MTANDFATAGFIDERFRYLVALLEQRAAPAPAPEADNVLYSYKKLAQVLDVTVETVSAWVNKGKRVDGRVVKLQVFRFTSEPRVPWPALLAYERGEDFDLASLPAPLLLPPAELQPAPLPKLTTATAPLHLRVAYLTHFFPVFLMSIDTLTGDEFADLTPQEHDEALALYAEAVSGQARALHELEPCTNAHEECLDKLARLLTLRKVHQVRRQEQADDEQFTASHSAGEQFLDNQRNPHLVS